MMQHFSVKFLISFLTVKYDNLHTKTAKNMIYAELQVRCRFGDISEMFFSSPGQSPGRAIVLPLVSALALASAAAALAKNAVFALKFFFVMGKALSGELSCPCDRSCCSFSEKM